MSARDRALEEEALTRAERSVGLMGLGFSDVVLERLDTFGARYGDQWVGRSPLELVAEVREEAADIGGWSALLLQRILLEPGLDSERSLSARMLLEEVMAKAAEADRMLRQIVLELRG